jgi:hypothetical protein
MPQKASPEGEKQKLEQMRLGHCHLPDGVPYGPPGGAASPHECSLAGGAMQPTLSI